MARRAGHRPELLALGLVVGLVGGSHAQPVSETVADGLHVIHGAGGAIAVRVTDSGTALVDTGAPEAWDDVTRLLADLTSVPVTHVFVTHHHADQVGGVAELAGHTALVMHADARARAAEAGRPVAPRFVFRTRSSVFLGDREVRAHHFGAAHTQGDVVIEFPDLGVIHVGGLVPPGLPFVDHDGGGSLGSWIDALGRVLALDFDVAIPSDGPTLTRPEVQAYRDRLVTLKARVTQLVEREVDSASLASQLVTDDLGWAPAPDDPFLTRSLAGVVGELVAARDATSGPEDGSPADTASEAEGTAAPPAATPPPC